MRAYMFWLLSWWGVSADLFLSVPPRFISWNYKFQIINQKLNNAISNAPQLKYLAGALPFILLPYVWLACNINILFYYSPYVTFRLRVLGDNWAFWNLQFTGTSSFYLWIMIHLYKCMLLNSPAWIGMSFLCSCLCCFMLTTCGLNYIVWFC